MPIPTLIQAGKLRHRIKIVQPTLTQDSTGGTDVRENTVVWECWASIEALSGRESLVAQALMTSVTHQITIRYAPGIRITARMRVLFGSRLFFIESALNPDERNKMLILKCTEHAESSLTQTV